MSDLKYVPFNVPRDLLEEFDEAIKGKYGNRTAALHEAMRLLIQKLKEA